MNSLEFQSIRPLSMDETISQLRNWCSFEIVGTHSVAYMIDKLDDFLNHHFDIEDDDVLKCPSCGSTDFRHVKTIDTSEQDSIYDEEYVYECGDCGAVVIYNVDWVVVG